MEAIKNLRALYLAKILFEQSDEAHPLSTRQLIETLEKEYGISAHRVTIYEDMEQLRAFGFDVYKNESSRRDLYMIASTADYLQALKEEQAKSGIYNGKVCVHLNGHVECYHKSRAFDRCETKQ